uniref:Uncharacterized protein n=1 Tax=Solanum tuberosum TaxID=4113 RepID=M1A0C3_SOLTU
MLYKATLTLFILFIFLGGLLFPVAPTRMTPTDITRDLRQIDSFFNIPSPLIYVPIDNSPPDHRP